MFGSKASEMATFLTPKDALWPVLLEAVRRIGGVIKVADTTTGELRANVSPSMWSYGEAVTVQLTAHGSDATTVSVESRCRMPLTIADWGKNTSNVRRILLYARTSLASVGSD